MICPPERYLFLLVAGNDLAGGLNGGGVVYGFMYGGPDILYHACDVKYSEEIDKGIAILRSVLEQ